MLSGLRLCSYSSVLVNVIVNAYHWIYSSSVPWYSDTVSWDQEERQICISSHCSCL